MVAHLASGVQRFAKSSRPHPRLWLNLLDNGELPCIVFALSCNPPLVAGFQSGSPDFAFALLGFTERALCTHLWTCMYKRAITTSRRKGKLPC